MPAPILATSSAKDMLIVEQVVVPVVRAHGLELFELVLRRERSGWVLRVVIERPDCNKPGGGVTVDLCADISRELSAALDVADPISHPYALEVSSPGLDRPLRDETDFARFAGQRAKVVLANSLSDGQHVVRGVLGGVHSHSVRIQREAEEGPLEIPLQDIKAANLVFEFGAGRSNQPRQPKKNSKKHKKRTGQDR